jgi:hypothetical protein
MILQVAEDKCLKVVGGTNHDKIVMSIPFSGSNAGWGGFAGVVPDPDGTIGKCRTIDNRFLIR